MSSIDLLEEIAGLLEKMTPEQRDKALEYMRKLCE